MKELLAMNRNALRFLHDAEGFDFEKPFFITEQYGKFTVNTVKNAVREGLGKVPYQCKVALFVVPEITSNKRGLYFAVLDGDRIDGNPERNVSYWEYYTKNPGGNIGSCYGVGDFEGLRKKHTKKIFLIAQDKEYILTPKKKELDPSARYILLVTRKAGDGRGHTYVSRMELLTTDGSGTKYKYEPYQRFYLHEKRSSDIADFIDKSGYLLRPHRMELRSRAIQLREERQQAEADNADFSGETDELQALLDSTKKALADALMACDDLAVAKEIASGVSSFARALSWFEDYKGKLAEKKYQSVDQIRSDIGYIRAKLSACIQAETEERK